MIPAREIFVRRGGSDLELNWHIHISSGLNHDYVWAGLDASSGIFVGVISWCLRGHIAVPQIELKVIRENCVLLPHIAANEAV